MNKISNISLCIPCFPRDTEKLFRCLESINKQTMMPLEVIIGHSEMSDEQKNTLHKRFVDKKYKFPVVISNVEKKAFAAENRNRAAANAKGKYISFFDSDDYMYKQRIEIVEELFNKYNVKCILHSFHQESNFAGVEISENVITYSDKDIVKGDVLYMLYSKYSNWAPMMYFSLKKLQQTKFLPPMTHGHVSITNDVIQSVKQNETQHYRRCEDARFIYDIFTYYNNKLNKNDVILYLPKPLTYYVHSNAQK
jgi:glycosyltransferase involved in cell wall biosynthesis